MISAKLWLNSFLLGAIVSWATWSVSANDEEAAVGQGGEFSGALSLMFGGYNVSGDSELFTAHRWHNDDVVGGIEDFTFRQGSLSLEGSVIFNERDYRLALTLTPRENVTIRAGIENYTRYFDDTGGYYQGLSYSLGEDLFLEIGKIWAEIELTFEELPTIIIGYENRYKEGTKSYLEWNSDAFTGKQIYPATKDIDENVHILKLDLSDDFNGFEFANNLRYEIYDNNTSRSDLVPAGLAGAAEPQGHPVKEDDREYDMLSNAFTVEKWLTDQLFFSAGYLTVHHDLTADFAMAYEPTNGVFGSHDKFYEANGLELDQESHVFSLGTFYLPVETISLSFGFQMEDTVTDSGGHENLRHGSGPTDEFADVESEIDTLIFQENIEIRYSGLPFSSIYAKATFWQDNYDQIEERFDDTGVQEFLRDTEADNDEQQYRIGFSTSPMTRLFLNTYYQRTRKNNDYVHKGNDFDATPSAGEGYEIGFINDLDHETDELAIKLSWRAANWLNTSFKYQLVRTDIDNNTKFVSTTSPGGNASSGDYQSHVYSVSAILTPISRFYFSTVLSVQDTRTRIPAIDAPAILDNYDGDVYTFLTSARYIFTSATDVLIGFNYSSTDNEQSNLSGLAQASDYNSESWSVTFNHRFNNSLSGKLRYESYRFRDSNYSNDADYTAHGLFGGLAMNF